MQDCLLQYSKETKMTGESKWKCPRCNKHQEAVQRAVLWKLPPILMVVLKRYTCTCIYYADLSMNVAMYIKCSCNCVNIRCTCSCFLREKLVKFQLTSLLCMFIKKLGHVPSYNTFSKLHDTFIYIQFPHEVWGSIQF